MADLKRRHHILLSSGDGLVAVLLLELRHLIQTHLVALDHAGRIKTLRADRKVRRIERERLMYLEPGNAERHHDVSHRVRLREHIFDFLAGVDVPFRNVLLVHGGLHLLGQTLALSDGLHRLERQLGLDAL